MVKAINQIFKLPVNHFLRLPLNAIVLSFLLIFNSVVSKAITKETIESLVNVDRVLNEPIELHITASEFAMVSSTVNLATEDAWLFFDNIRPAEVLSKYAAYLYVGDKKFSNGANGRVGIYAQGTVVMSHGSGYKPLTIYTDENLTGNSQQLEIHTYHNHLGDFDNKIKSFMLKRGYMATLATNADGSGYSRVFIADKNDIVFNVMPDELKSTVSFIRIFKHQWVSKKGWCGGDANEIAKINATCFYDWNVGGTTTANTEYSVIRQNAGWPSWNDINSKENVSHLAGYNEPDQNDQANMTFQQMIDIWPGMMNSGLRIGSPAYANPWAGNGGNLFDFINKCDELNYRVDFVALHCYWGGKSPMNWYKDLKYIHDATGRPLWITEWNNGANWTNEWWPDGSDALTDANAQKQLNDIKGILQVLDTTSFIERYFIYNWVEDCRAMILNGTLTPAGEYYAANKSQIAYNSAHEFIHHWNYLPAELSYRYVSQKKSIRLEWANPNQDLCTAFKIEKKANGEAYSTLYSSTNLAEVYYIDSINPVISGTISYRLSFLKPDGNYLNTNEISIYQTEAKDTIQIGKFEVRNFEWNMAFYSKNYTTEPLVFLGIPSFNNAMPFTKRVSYITNNYFKFRFEPWKYNSSNPLTKIDNFSSLCLPAGVYNFGGLNAEVNAVSELARDWVQVSFNKAFAITPVVLCSVASSNSQYPLTVGVRNITTTGFEIRLKTEEAINGFIIPETVNYLAIEPGTGSFEGKRITVGHSEDGAGIGSIPIEIAIDTTYRQPVIFAGLLSDENNNALTLRYTELGENIFKISAQRELSGTLSTIKKDALGWLIIDTSIDQVINSVNETNYNIDDFAIYPNPAHNTIKLNINAPKQVEIYDVNGRKVFDEIVTNRIELSSLQAGLYLIKINNKVKKLIIK